MTIPNNIPKELEELEELETLYLDAVNRQDISEIPVSFMMQLNDETLRHGTSNNFHIKQQLFVYWLYYFEETFTRVKDAPLFKDILDRFISLSLTESLLTKTILNTREAQTLACVCINRVSMACNGKIHPKNAHVGDLLHAWTGQKVDVKTIKSLEATVNFLYGPPAWALYRTDVEDDDALPWHLWKQEVPLLGHGFSKGLQRNAEAVNNYTLPGDLTNA